MSILASIVILLIGAFFSLFVFWQLLREDYEDVTIFSLGLTIILGGILGFLVTMWFLPQEKLLGILFGASLLGYLRAQRFKMLWNEVLEAATPSFFLFIPFIAGSIFVLGQALMYIIPELLLALFSLAVFWFLRAQYRQFLWYKSGKVGFAAHIATAVYFLVRVAIVIFFPGVLLLLSKTTTISLGLPIACGSIVVLYLQSGRGFRADIGMLGKLVRR